jgi:HlyD family secretion protein
MSAFHVVQARQLLRVVGALILLLIAGCGDPPKNRFQGYVEGEFVYVASPLAGQLETLSVQRGQQVTTGQPLFALDETAEKAAREQIEAALVLSEAEFARQEKLFRTGVAATQDLDRARSTRDQDKQRLTQSDWSFEQKKQATPQAGLVYDTLYRQGEWVAAGKPVVALLPPQNIKVRAFVPETRAGSIHYGDEVRVAVDGVRDPFIGKVSYISPHNEYTPPVIYSKESRDKLVFMIEAVFDPEVSSNLHPGQPVDVEFISGQELAKSK